MKDKKGEVSIYLKSLKLNTNVSMPQLASGTEISLSGFQINMDEAL